MEELTREAFWGSMCHPGCDGEHLLVHKLRKSPAFVPELDTVAEVDGNLAGHIIYSLAHIVHPDGQKTEVLNFGPLSVLPRYKGKGVGAALMQDTIGRAKDLGYRAIVFYGHPDYYPRFGFGRASAFGITTEKGKSIDALMAMPLYDGALDGVAGRYVEHEDCRLDPQEVALFEEGFPPKVPVTLPTIEALSGQFSSRLLEVFRRQKITLLPKLLEYSGVEILNWPGVQENDLREINAVLQKHGYAPKVFRQSADK